LNLKILSVIVIKVTCALLDMSTAFDMVDHGHLFDLGTVAMLTLVVIDLRCNR